jgi:hypothetical protein
MTVGSGISINLTEKDPLKQNAVIRGLIEGRSNAVVEASLTANQATTTVTAPTCGAGSAPIPVPMTTNAGAELGAGTLHISTVSNGSFVVTHANNAQTDRTFRFVCIG